jgi:hypothetical protein
MTSSSSSNEPEPAVGRAKIFKAAKYMMLKGFEDFPGAWSAMDGFRTSFCSRWKGLRPVVCECTRSANGLFCCSASAALFYLGVLFTRWMCSTRWVVVHLMVLGGMHDRLL